MTLTARHGADIRRLDGSHMDALMAITDEVGWGFTRQYWQVVLAAGAVFGLYRDEDTPAAVSAIFDYGPELSALGVVIVRERYRGQGLASLVIDAAEGGLERTGAPLLLISTADGQPVYERRGFVTVSECRKLVKPEGVIVGEPPKLENGRFVPVTEDNLDRVLELDRAVFGADRTPVIRAMFHTCLQALAVEQDGDLTGYAFLYARQGIEAIGPVVAENDAMAKALCQMLAYGREGGVRIDVLSHQATFGEALGTLGFQTAEAVPLMMLNGSSDLVSRPGAYALVSQTYG
ncbi:GNAT family N-acetyltransferase [Sneathiella chinensis]|uniref:Acetyltransferase n=1 Tax=Sneathiella chinensis TaxID=349750 RepID=A0ABQ5U5N7_9PROT|nr:GNAT family N-acetyltransferase [Sneathiella chinensis]GLQ06627.1 acetyltransferase [Sneathiella chinensis]